MNVSMLNFEVNLNSIMCLAEGRKNACKFIFSKTVIELFYMNPQHLSIFNLDGALAYYTPSNFVVLGLS